MRKSRKTFEGKFPRLASQPTHISHPEVWENWNEISTYPKELRRSLEAILLRKTKVLSEAIPNSHSLWNLIFWVLFCNHPSLHLFFFLIKSNSCIKVDPCCSLQFGWGRTATSRLAFLIRRHQELQQELSGQHCSLVIPRAWVASGRAPGGKQMQIICASLLTWSLQGEKWKKKKRKLLN